MKVHCNACDEKFEVSDELVSQSSLSSVLCPNCNSDVRIRMKSDASQDLEFYFNEQLCEYEKKALICNTIPEATDILKEYLADEGFLIHIPSNLNEALRCLVSYNYNLIILNENFGVQASGRNSVLAYLNYRMPIVSRRSAIVLLLTSRYKTLNRLAAFNHSVNAVLNINDLDSCHIFLKEVAQEYEKKYQTFNHVMQSLQESMFAS